MDFLSSLVQEAITILYNISASFGFANYGFAIKMATYPLTKKQIQSMKAMQRLQPKMKAIQEKYKGDKMKANEALAQLYKSEGVNPLAGCLPLLIQMPILIGIFYGIRDFQYAGSPLSEFMSAGGPEMYAYAVLPVLSALTTFLQSKMTMPDTSTTQNQVMLYGMPLFIGYISISFPTGLVLYWVVMNIMQIGQQLFMERGQKK